MVLHLKCSTIFRCLQPGASEEAGQEKTVLTRTAFVGTFFSNPKCHRLGLLFTATKACEGESALPSAPMYVLPRSVYGVQRSLE